MQIRAVGIPWYRPEDFAALRLLFADGHVLHDTHAEWLKAAEGLEKRIKAQGGIAERVYVYPNEFTAWCRTNGFDLNAQARTRFANEFVARKHGQTH
jgi:hypothetical protein